MVGDGFQLLAEDGNDMTAQLRTFAAAVGLDYAADGRYSLLLLLQLWAGYVSGRQNPPKIVDELRALEAVEGSQTKLPTQFRYPPLKGLFHKHYLPDGVATLALNIENELDKAGIPLFKQRMGEGKKADAVRVMTRDDIAPIVADMVGGSWERRASRAALTGEWIVYAHHEGKNYYLCLARHDEDHARVRAEIDAVCCSEFPFLGTLLGSV